MQTKTELHNIKFTTPPPTTPPPPPQTRTTIIFPYKDFKVVQPSKTSGERGPVTKLLVCRRENNKNKLILLSINYS